MPVSRPPGSAATPRQPTGQPAATGTLAPPATLAKPVSATGDRQWLAPRPTRATAQGSAIRQRDSAPTRRSVTGPAAATATPATAPRGARPAFAPPAPLSIAKARIPAGSAPAWPPPDVFSPTWRTEPVARWRRCAAPGPVRRARASATRCAAARPAAAARRAARTTAAAVGVRPEPAPRAITACRARARATPRRAPDAAPARRA